MKKQLVLGFLGACVLSGNAQTFKEWQDPEINAINRAPMHANFFAYENAEIAAKAVKEDSKNFMSLNGTWKFFWVGKENLVPQRVPSNLDYDMWLGPAPYKPYNPHRVHQTFRGYWDYDGGGLGEMGQHYIDPVQYILGKDDTSPIKVEVDAPQQHPDAVGTWRSITYTYDDGCQIVLWGGDFGDPNTPYIAGPKGNVYKNFVCDIPDWEKKLADFPEPEPQVTDFIECVKTRQPFALNEKNGFRSATIVNMGAVALRLNRTLNFDPVKLEFIDDEAANRLLDQPMRAPWNI